MTTFKPVSILAALGGRFQWRWWIAAALWLMTALGSYPVLLVRNLPYTVFPAAVLTVATAVSLLLIWGWGTRFALGLGHRRGPVFVVTVAGSLALVWGSYLLEQAARWAEFQLSSSLRVFLAAYPGDKFYTEEFFDSSAAMLIVMATPLGVVVCCVLAVGMRWGVLAGIAAAVGGVALVPAMIFPAEWASGVGVPFGVTVAAVSCIPLAVAWFAFRKQPA